MLRRQDLAALTTTRRQNRTAATGRHTSTEAVRLRTLPDIGLVGPFHVSSFYACPFEGKARRLYGSTPNPSTHVGRAATRGAQDPFARSTKCRSLGRIASVGQLLSKRKTFPVLWILWKRQVSCSRFLWITRPAALWGRRGLASISPTRGRWIVPSAPLKCTVW